MVVLREERLTQFKQNRRNFTAEDGEQTTYIHLNVDVPEDPSDIDVDEQKVIQSRESDKNETTHQQLKRSNRIQRSNPKYANTTIVEDGDNKSET